MNSEGTSHQNTLLEIPAGSASAIYRLKLWHPCQAQHVSQIQKHYCILSCLMTTPKQQVQPELANKSQTVSSTYPDCVKQDFNLAALLAALLKVFLSHKVQ